MKQITVTNSDIVPSANMSIQSLDPARDLVDDDNCSKSKSTPNLKEALTLVARRRAAEVAIESVKRLICQARTEDKFGDKMKQYIKLHAELRALNATSEIDLLNILDKMDQYEKIHLAFKLVDFDNSGDITVVELAHILQLTRSHDDARPEEALRTAELSMAAHDSNCSGCLNIQEFAEFIESIANFVDKSIDEITYGLVMEITCLYNYKSILDEVLDLEIFNLNASATSSRFKNKRSSPGMRKTSQIERARLFILFQLIHAVSGGKVDDREEAYVLFPHIIGAMAPISKNMDKEFRMMLFYVEDDNERFRGNMYYRDFLEFFDAVVAASPPELSLQYTVDVMTAHVCKDSENTRTSSSFHDSLKGIFSHASLSETNSRPLMSELGFNSLMRSNIISYQDKSRIRHLFNLWDTNHDGLLDTAELYLGLRKFYESKDRDETMSETLSIMKEAQGTEGTSSGLSPTLTREQFENILVNFTAEVGVDLCEMIEFMYMETVVQDTHKSKATLDEEMQYIKTHSKEPQCIEGRISLCVYSIMKGLAEEEVPISNRAKREPMQWQ